MSLFLTFAGVVVGPPSFAQVVARTGSFPLAYLGIGIVMVLVGLFLILTWPGTSRPPTARLNTQTRTQSKAGQ